MAGTRDALVVNPKYFEETNTFIEQTVKKWPDSKSLLYCLTKIHFHSGDHERFLKILSRTAEAHKDTKEEAIDFLIGYGAKFANRRRMLLAGDVYETLLKTFPETASLLSSLGAIYIKRGYTKKAMMYFKKAFQLAPQDSIVVSNTAFTAMLMTDFELAERALKQKAKLFPKKASILFELAINAMATSPDHSLPYWEKYFELNAKYPDEFAQVKNAKMIQNAIKTYKDDTWEWLPVGVQMRKQNKPHYAVALMHFVKSKHPKDAGISYKLAHAYDIGKHYDLEEQALLEALRKMKYPQDKFKKSKSVIYYALARCVYRLGRLDDTEAYLKNVKTDSKKAANADYMYGLVSQSRGNKEKAQGYFKSCVKKAKGDRIKEHCESQIAE